MPDYRPITPAECYELARRDWMPAAAADAFVRCARTLEKQQSALDECDGALDAYTEADGRSSANEQLSAAHIAVRAAIGRRA